MRICPGIMAAVLGLLVGGTCQAFDLIKTHKKTLMGRVVRMSPLAVELEGVGGVSKEIPVNEIETVFFETDPSDLKTAKTHVLGGRYADGLAALERIKEKEAGRPENRQEVEFYKALCAAKLALAGKGKIVDAGRLMKAFVDNNAKSHHYFEASEIVGDLLVAIEQYDQAAEYYGRLENAPWSDYKMRAGVAAGQALLARGEIAQAESTFDRVIGMNAEGELAQSQRLAARLGKARAFSAAEKPEAAIRVIEDVLKTADVKDVSLMGRAYNAKGTAYRQLGQTKEALLAFLHVDILYASQPEIHAEALANLADLWQEVHKTERANAARKTLMEDYKDSPWARKEGG